MGAIATLLATVCCLGVAQARPKVIKACYSEGDSRLQDHRELRFLPHGRRCASSEMELWWNKAGPRGPRGKQGMPGSVLSCECAGNIDEPHGDAFQDEEIEEPPHKSGVLDTLKKIIEFAGVVVGLAVAGLLTPIVVFFAALNALARTPGVKDWGIVRRLRPATFVMETLDDSALGQRIGPAISGLVRNRISVREDRYGLDYVTGQRIIKKTLQSFKDLSPSLPALSGAAGVVIAVIDFLRRTLPKRRFVLRGELQPAGPSGPGISLALQYNKGEDSLVVFWARPLEIHAKGVLAYQRLAIPSAAWADHRLTKALDDDAPSELLSKNTDSWAFFRAGLECHRLGEDEAARSLYEQALGHDGNNVGALANLGLIERRAHKFARAQELLTRARKLAERDEQRCKLALYRILYKLAGRTRKPMRRDDPWNKPDWYRILYQLAALHLNRANRDASSERSGNDVQRARRQARKLARKSIEIILDKRKPSRWQCWRRLQTVARVSKERRQLAEFLEATIAPSALTLLAGALLVSGQTPSPDAPDLRCYKQVKRALKSPEPDGEKLVQFVARQRGLAPRAYYNLACYEMTRKRRPEAMRWLKLAFLRTMITERAALLKAVERDDTLVSLVEDENTLSALRKYASPQA